MEKVYFNGPGHMTKMAATPIYDKNLQNSFPTVYINDDPELTLTYFTAISNFAKLVSVLIYQVSVYRTIGPLVYFVKDYVYGFL